MSDRLDDYPQDTEDPAEWAAFLARHLGNRPSTRDSMGLVARIIVEAIKEARRASEHD